MVVKNIYEIYIFKLFLSLLLFLLLPRLLLLDSWSGARFLFLVSDFQPFYYSRENANGIDLNENFPELFNDSQPKDPRQNEVKAMIDWIMYNRFILSVSLIGGAKVVVYPFDAYVDGMKYNDVQYRRKPLYGGAVILQFMYFLNVKSMTLQLDRAMQLLTTTSLTIWQNLM